MVVMLAMGRRDELFALSWASRSCGASSTISRRRSLISLWVQGHALEMALDKVPVILLLSSRDHRGSVMVVGLLPSASWAFPPFTRPRMAPN